MYSVDKYIYNFFFLGALSISCALMGMSEEDMNFLVNPKSSSEDRIELIDNYSYCSFFKEFDINKDIRCGWTIPTIYIDEMHSEEMKYPNSILDYCFQKGARFCPEDCYSYYKPIFSYILWRNNPSCEKNKNIEEKELLQRSILLTQICVDAKLKHSGIYDKINHFNALCWLCLALNKQKSKNVQGIKIPRVIIQLLAYKSFATEEDALVDISSALAQKKMYIEEEDRVGTHLGWLRKKFGTLVNDEQSYKEYGVAIFDHEEWKKNPAILINNLRRRFQEKK